VRILEQDLVLLSTSLCVATAVTYLGGISAIGLNGSKDDIIVEPDIAARMAGLAFRKNVATCSCLGIFRTIPSRWGE